MTEKIAAEIQKAQEHGRTKYGSGPDDFAHDDWNTDGEWRRYIDDHNQRAYNSTPLERRAELIKVAGLAVSAIEAIDRKAERKA